MRNIFVNRQSIIGWVLLCLSIVYGLIAIKFPKGTNELGPSFLPVILAIAMSICSLIIIFKNKIPKESNNEDTSYKIGKKQILLVVYFAFFLLVVPFAGFVITSLIFLSFVFLLYGNKGTLRSILYSIILTVSMYCLFKLFLEVPLNLM